MTGKHDKHNKVVEPPKAEASNPFGDAPATTEPVVPAATPTTPVEAAAPAAPVAEQPVAPAPAQPVAQGQVPLMAPVANQQAPQQYPQYQQYPPYPPQPMPNGPAYGAYVQYDQYGRPIMQQPSMGTSGWLAFFMVCFFISGIGNLFGFVAYLSGIAGVSSLSTSGAFVFNMIGALLTGSIMLVAGVMIAMCKKVAKTLSYAAIATTVICSTVSSILTLAALNDSFSYYSSSRNAVTTLTIGGIIIQWIVYGLVATYFAKSRQVRETLVK